MKVLELITDAYRARNIIDESTQPDAEQTAVGLKKLNQMASEWLANGIDIQYVPVALADVANETLTIPTWAEGGVTSQLALRINSARPVTAELAQQALDGMATIENQSLQDKLRANNMRHVPAGAGFPRTVDVRTI